jgi:hypothetical protein
MDDFPPVIGLLGEEAVNLYIILTNQIERFRIDITRCRDGGGGGDECEASRYSYDQKYHRGIFGLIDLSAELEAVAQEQERIQQFLQRRRTALQMWSESRIKKELAESLAEANAKTMIKKELAESLAEANAKTMEINTKIPLVIQDAFDIALLGANIEELNEMVKYAHDTALEEKKKDNLENARAAVKRSRSAADKIRKLNDKNKRELQDTKRSIKNSHYKYKKSKKLGYYKGHRVGIGKDSWSRKANNNRKTVFRSVKNFDDQKRQIIKYDRLAAEAEKIASEAERVLYEPKIPINMFNNNTTNDEQLDFSNRGVVKTYMKPKGGYKKKRKSKKKKYKRKNLKKEVVQMKK